MGAQDEVVVVFGGGSGIGEAVARRVLARGSRVVIVGRDRDRLAAASSRLAGRRFAVGRRVVPQPDGRRVEVIGVEVPHSPRRQVMKAVLRLMGAAL